MQALYKWVLSCNPFIVILHVVTILKQHRKSSGKIFSVHRVRDTPWWKNPAVQVNDTDWSYKVAFYYEIDGME